MVRIYTENLFYGTKEACIYRCAGACTLNPSLPFRLLGKTRLLCHIHRQMPYCHAHFQRCCVRFICELPFVLPLHKQPAILCLLRFGKNPVKVVCHLVFGGNMRKSASAISDSSRSFGAFYRQTILALVLYSTSDYSGFPFLIFSAFFTLSVVVYGLDDM